MAHEADKIKRDTPTVNERKAHSRIFSTRTRTKQQCSSWYILVNIVGQEIRGSRNIVVASSLEPLKVRRGLATLHPLLKSQGWASVVDRVTERFGETNTAHSLVAVIGGGAATAVSWAAYGGGAFKEVVQLLLLLFLMLPVNFLVSLLVVDDFNRAW